MDRVGNTAAFAELSFRLEFEFTAKLARVADVAGHVSGSFQSATIFMPRIAVSAIGGVIRRVMFPVFCDLFHSPIAIVRKSRRNPQGLTRLGR